MADKPDKKSTFLSRTVKNIKKHRKAKNFIRVERNEAKEIGKKFKKPRKNEKFKTGLIFISHLPAGFYEKELKRYFMQFGDVTNVKLERSKETGRSKGYAFVEFKSQGVAKIAAETMNNYIMFNRILKAELVTKKYNKKEFWENKVDAKNYPKKQRVQENVRGMNKPCSELREKSRLRRRITRLDEMMQRLKEKGIDYSYKPAIRREIAFSPSDNGKYIPLDTDIPVLENDEHNLPVLEIDESDKEIEFMTPPNVIKRKLLLSKARKSPLNKKNKTKQGKIKKEKKGKIAKKKITSANEQEIQKCTVVKQEPISNEKCEFQINVTPEVKKKNNKKPNSQISQKLKSLSQEKVSKKQRNLKKGEMK